MTSPQPQTRRGSGGAQLALVAISDMAVWLGASMIYPYLPIFLTEETGAEAWMIGVIFSAYFVTVWALASRFGRLSDRVGRKPLMVFGTLLYSVSTLLMLTTRDPWLFTLFRAVEGVGVACVVPAAQAFVAEITADDKRSGAFGWLSSAQFGGLIIGPVFGWLVYEAAGGSGLTAFYAIFVVSAVVTLVSAALLMLFLREPEGEDIVRGAGGAAAPRPPLRALLTRPVLAIIVVSSTAEFALTGFDAVWGLWLDDIGVPMVQIGLTFAAFSIPMLFSFLGGRAADRMSRYRLMIVGFAFQSVGWFVLPVTETYMVIVTILFLSGLTFAFAYPAKQAFLVQVSPRAWLGAVQGLEQSGMNMAATFGSLLLPVLYGPMGGWVFVVAGVVSGAGVAWAAPTLRREWGCIVAGSSGVMSCADAERLLAGSADDAAILEADNDPSRGAS